ncbi:LPS biosynthesis protein WbpP, partial [bacterium]|nr:LPS biosynthesis protein WbpP [bacterium]
GVLELATLMREVVGNAPEPEFTPAREGDIRNSRADLTKSGAKLGFMPQVDLREGLTRTVEWLRGSGDFSQTVNQ